MAVPSISAVTQATIYWDEDFFGVWEDKCGRGDMFLASDDTVELKMEGDAVLVSVYNEADVPFNSVNGSAYLISSGHSWYVNLTNDGVYEKMRQLSYSERKKVEQYIECGLQQITEDSAERTLLDLAGSWLNQAVASAR